MLELKNITKKYGKKVALEDVSFTVKSGDVCGLLGLNGAGKSTLMKIICHLCFADKGEVVINGKVYDSKDNYSIGAMIESPAFYRELTGRQNLKMLSKLYCGITDNDIQDALNVCGIADSADIKVKKYSLGMKQRLYFGYALMKKTDLLILDEPFNGIDPVSIKLFRDIIRALAGAGCSVLISGHVITELQKVCDEIVIIDKGKKIFKGKNEGDLETLFLSMVSGSGDAQ